MVSFDFFAAMGGLFSLWIGASVMTIYDCLQVLIKLWLHMHSHVKKTTDKFTKNLNQRNQGIRVRHDEKRRREIFGEYHHQINYQHQPGFYPGYQPNPTHRIRPRAPNNYSYHY